MNLPILGGRITIMNALQRGCFLSTDKEALLKQ